MSPSACSMLTSGPLPLVPWQFCPPLEFARPHSLRPPLLLASRLPPGSRLLQPGALLLRQPFLPLLLVVRRERRGRRVRGAFHHHAHQCVAVLLRSRPPTAQLCREHRIHLIRLVEACQERRAAALLLFQREAETLPTVLPN